MNKLSLWQLAKLSRPRFWIYELWPYIIGIMSWLVIYLKQYGNVDISNMQIIYMVLMGLYFMIPANLYIYGINDIYDYETDKNNPKKQWYEQLLTPDKHLYTRLAIVLCGLPFLIMQLFLPNILWLIFIGFLFFAGFYSAKPIRAKSVPVLDVIFSSLLYVIPSIYGYAIVMWNIEKINRIYILAWICRCVAMHIYSAIPDISVDLKAKMETTATKLWYNRSLYICIIMYILAWWMSWSWIWWLSLGMAMIYIYFMIRSITNPQNIFSYYKIFSWLNLAIGFILFLAIAYQYYMFAITL